MSFSVVRDRLTYSKRREEFSSQDTKDYYIRRQRTETGIEAAARTMAELNRVVPSGIEGPYSDVRHS